MSQIWAESNFELVPTVGRYLRKATLKNHCFNFLTLLKHRNETYRTDISFLFWPSISLLNFKKSAVLLGKSRAIIYSIHWECFTFMNFNLLRIKRNENWTFWGSPSSITIWLVYLSSGGRTKDQGPRRKTNQWTLGNFFIYFFPENYITK